MFALFNLIILPCAQTTKLYDSILSLFFFLIFLFFIPPSFSLFFPCLLAVAARCQVFFFFPAGQRSKLPGAEAPIVGLTHDCPGAGAEGGGQRVRGHPGALPPLVRGISPKPWRGSLLFLFFFYANTPPCRGAALSPRVVSSRCSPLRVLRRGRKQREGAPPPASHHPKPSAAPLFACHVYNLVETKTDICGREKMTFTSPDHSLK